MEIETVMDQPTTPQEVVAFWQEAGPKAWFTQNPAFDRLCRERFLGAHETAAAGRLGDWEQSAEGALALIVLLDQMPRNMFRGDPRTWATDPLALAVADRALAKGFDRHVSIDMQQFLYLPFMHAEDLAAQERSLVLYEARGDAENLKFARHHRDIVARFGRFPHRNEVLGRKSTPEELAFLEEDAFRG